MRYALDVAGADGWIVTNLDVLTGFEEIRAAVRYRVDGQETRDWPAGGSSLERVEPVYATLPGWSEDITGVRRYEDLPAARARYVEWLESEVGAPSGWSRSDRTARR
jgi:adenylosuccinate synthase